jgi:hypothetical protein
MRYGFCIVYQSLLYAELFLIENLYKVKLDVCV